MTRTFLEILPFALGGAVSPVLLASVTLLLASPRGRLKGGAFFLGTLVFSIGFTIAVYFLLRRVGLAHPSKAQIHRDAVVDLVVGVVLVLWAILRILRGPHASARDHADRARRVLSPAGAFLSGIALMAVNFSTLPLYAMAIRDIGRSRLAGPDQLLLLAVVTVIILLPAWLPVLTAALAPQHSARFLAGLRGGLSRHSWTIVTVLLLGFGFYLVLKGGPNLWPAAR